MSTIEKALGLLEHFSSQRPQIGLSDFKTLTDFDKGTVHRYLTALRDCGFLEQNPTTKAYRLGPAVIRLSAVREKTVPLVSTVALCLDEIAADVLELVHASLPQRNGMSTLYAVYRGNHSTRVAFEEAEILPFHATSSGIAQLAFGPPDLRERALKGDLRKFTRHTPTSLEDVEKRIEDARRCGFASTEELYETDVSSVAVPFFDPGALAMGTIAIAAPTTRMTKDRREAFLSVLTQASLDLTESLGGRLPADLLPLYPSGPDRKARRR